MSGSSRTAGGGSGHGRGSTSAAVESPARVELPGGALACTLRRSQRARRPRVVVDLRRGVVLTVPLRRRPFGGADPTVERFLREREAWLRRHLERQARARARVVVAMRIIAAMPVLTSRMDPASEEARRNRAEMEELVGGLRRRQEQVAGRGAAGLWVLRATRTNRRLVADHRALFEARFPGSGAAWLRALTDVTHPMPQTPALLCITVAGDRLFPARLR